MIGPFIFLDIDGVLNGHDRRANGYCGVDQSSVGVLNTIIGATGAKIIVSSAWRYFVLRGEMTIQGFSGMMCTHGLLFGCIVDVLGPDIEDGVGGADRGAGVKEWFRKRFGIAHEVAHVAFDDMDLCYTLHDIPFFQTNPELGLGGSMSRWTKRNIRCCSMRARQRAVAKLVFTAECAGMCRRCVLWGC